MINSRDTPKTIIENDKEIAVLNYPFEVYQLHAHCD